MKEIYVISFNGQLTLAPYSRQYGIEKPLVDALEKSDLTGLVPLVSVGDPKLMRATVFTKEGFCGGVIVVYTEDGKPAFCAIARTWLELSEGAAHFSRMASELRYGADIYENK